MPATGKNNYMHFFVKVLPEFLKDDVVRDFIFLDLRVFFGNTINDFKSLIEDTILKEDSSGQKIVILYHIDELPMDILEPALKVLNVLRDEPHHLKYIFVTHRPGSELTSHEVLQSRLFGATAYYQPCNLRDFLYELKIFEDELELNLSRPQKDFLFDLTGGLTIYSKIILSHEKVELVAGRKSIIDSDLLDRDEIKMELLSRTKEITRILTSDEIENLKSIAEGKNVKPQKILTDWGLVTIDEDTPSIFSEILSSFLKS